MDRTPVPGQGHRAPQVLQQVPQEAPDIQPREIPRADPNVQREAPAFGRHREGVDRGEPVLLVEVVEVGRLALGSPGALDVRDEQELALIEEDQMGPPAVCVFLYGAT